MGNLFSRVHHINLHHILCTELTGSKTFILIQPWYNLQVSHYNPPLHCLQIVCDLCSFLSLTYAGNKFVFPPEQSNYSLLLLLIDLSPEMQEVNAIICLFFFNNSWSDIFRTRIFSRRIQFKNFTWATVFCSLAVGDICTCIVPAITLEECLQKCSSL